MKTTAVLCMALGLAAGVAGGAERMVTIPAYEGTAAPTSEKQQTALLAGGCFWGVQGVFQHTRGVSRAESGYAGGDRATADYYTVSS